VNLSIGLYIMSLVFVGELSYSSNGGSVSVLSEDNIKKSTVMIIRICMFCEVGVRMETTAVCVQIT
jgi:hypothetical protein